MELIAVLVMIAIGGAVALFVLIALAIARGEKQSRDARPADRDHVAASILFQILIAGGVGPEEATGRVRRGAGLGARITPGVDVTTWAEAYGRGASAVARAQLLESAVQLAISRPDPVPLRQYAALLDLSFGLGFHSDALARLREQYGFTYVDHAKDARPREADRHGGSTPLFVRDESGRREWLRVLEIEGTPDRRAIIAAYRRLAAQHHPDRFHDHPEEVRRGEALRFIEITRAYERLLALDHD